jgi:hypothetical protein
LIFTCSFIKILNCHDQWDWISIFIAKLTAQMMNTNLEFFVLNTKNMMKDDDHERCIFISYSCLCPVFCVNDGCHTHKDSHLHLCEQRNRTMTNDRIQTTHYLNFALDFHISIFVKLLKSNGCHTFEFPSLWSNITDRRTP